MVAPTHTWNGINYADAFHISLSIIGFGLVLGGLILVWAPWKLKWLVTRQAGINPVK
jgi:hypothetical protein